MPNEEIDRLPPPDPRGRIVLTPTAKSKASLVRLLVILSCCDVAGIIVCIALAVPLPAIILFAASVSLILALVGLRLVFPPSLIIDDNTITIIQNGIRQRLEIKNIRNIGIRNVVNQRHETATRTVIDVSGLDPKHAFIKQLVIAPADFGIKPSAITDLLYQRTGLEKPADDQVVNSATSPVLSAR